MKHRVMIGYAGFEITARHRDLVEVGRERGEIVRRTLHQPIEFRQAMAVREFWGAHASNVLVSAFCRKELLFRFRYAPKRMRRESSRKPGGFRQHATSVRSPANRSPLAFRSLFERNEIQATHAQFSFSANQRTQSQAAATRLNGNPRTILLRCGTTIPRRFIRD